MGFMIEIQLKDKCIMTGKFTAVEVGMLGTLSTIALKINPILFITPFTTRLHRNPAMVTKKPTLFLDLAKLSMQGMVVATLIVSSMTLSAISFMISFMKAPFSMEESFSSSTEKHLQSFEISKKKILKKLTL